ncbi:hypothetical protein D9611_004249 [Ephemerocybe angulata]|uniref:Nuclear transport factor 2 n=1 Tax=Ephemerocybe angulata TaxID=980116 RepID=A0A8H5BJS0_9AGAR|nr:hypothetical protein D9611_004249 [Tulosesus angulatus]
MSADLTAVGKQFADFYYQTFDGNRANLGPLYRDFSMLTFEGSPIQGTTNILEKLTSLPFQTVKHIVTTMDVQPTTDGKILVLVTGMLQVDDSPNPLAYNQVFHLVPEGTTYFVLNDIFRLNLA